MHSIVYALGLEQILGPSRQVPLTPVMKSRLQTPDESEETVIDAGVYVELENGQGEVITVFRSTSGSRDARLITVYLGAGLTENLDSLPTVDYFATDGGAATHERGYHKFLAEFLGWHLPQVPHFDGTLSPLYLQCIFPLAIVEQKHGWSRIQANSPRFLGIRDVDRRAFEFILDLDVSELAAAREHVAQEDARIRSEWKALFSEATILAGRVNGTMRSWPLEPTSLWPPEPIPEIGVFVEDDLIGLSKAIDSREAEAREMREREVPTVEDNSGELEDETGRIVGELGELQSTLTALLRDRDMRGSQMASLRVRISTLADDIEHYRDIVKLRKIGSIENLSLTRQQCPTCQQSLQDALLPQSVDRDIMSPEDNMDFLEEQLYMFRRMLEGLVAEEDASEQAIRHYRERVSDAQQALRAARRSLNAHPDLPSLAVIERRTRLEQWLEIARDVMVQFRLLIEKTDYTAQAWAELQGKKAGLPKGSFSKSDEEKLDRFERLFVSNQEQFGFDSFSPNLLGVARDSYRPMREGYDLLYDISASDNIRTIWAYLYSLLELAREARTNHPGLLILDEPQQQKTKQVSFAKFLGRAASASQRSQQVIFASSESEDELRGLCGDIDCNLISFPGKILQPI